MKKILAVLLAVIIVAALTVSAVITVSATGDPTIVVSSVTASRGATVDVKIGIKNNPGITSMKIEVAFPSDLTVVSWGEGSHDGKYVVGNSLDDGEYEPTNSANWVKYDIVDKAGLAMQPINNEDNSAPPVGSMTLNWFTGSNTDNFSVSDTTFATIKFKVADNAEFGDKAITVTYDEDDIYNSLENNVAFAVENGKVSVTDVKKGDVNGDGKVNAQDVTFLRRKVAGGYNFNFEFNMANADINGDNKVNAQDVTFLRRHVAGGYPSADQYFN